eukprot:TRINITY_DN2767_c0_g1_i1.p1 TRINITY_DN2767_c0_g1~~TRINITY_DN2767_c0_g1_i1.p1  ORF type:complete len:468 (-),score=102.56 TRINITY_DN2767_c0_g1_i1:160-1563(-)
MLNMILHTQHLYFTYSQFDITRTLQSNFANPGAPSNQWLQADPRFSWNRHLQQDFLQLNKWALLIMMGSIQIESMRLKGHSYEFALISRRNQKRAGTRFNVRGVDSEGNVANNVETEQILDVGDQIASFVQTRGSVPIIWQQLPDLKYKPRMSIIGNAHANTLAFRKHFEEQIKLYGHQIVVSLIDHHGQEKTLADEFESQIRTFNNPMIRYVNFDFHRHCKNMKYHNLSLLLNQTGQDLEKYGYFIADKERKVLMTQSGVFRTNCIDNLDRTNVVQSLFARDILQSQLRRVGAFSKDDVIANYPEIEVVFKNAWANNGDVLSVQYSGTGALKSDFTRTGRRTLHGVLRDGINSAQRYFLNNFKDGERQDAFDLFLGNYTVNLEGSPFNSKRINPVTFIYGAIFLVGFFMLVLSLVDSSETNLIYRALFVLFWIFALVAAWRIAMTYGKEIVDRPSLVSHYANPYKY